MQRHEIEKRVIRIAIVVHLLLIIFIVVALGQPVREKEAGMKIQLTVNGEVFTATMLDSEASRDFISLLPMTLKMKDYAGTEKVSDLPKKLSTDDAPAGYDPTIGDLTYYSPWGNLALFYKDFGYARGLVKLGSLDAGSETFASMNGDFQVAIAVVE